MGTGTNKVPPEGTWARLIYDLRQVEATKTQGVREGWYDPRSPNYRGARFGFEDVDWSVLRGTTQYATPEQRALREQYARQMGVDLGSQVTNEPTSKSGPTRLPPDTSAMGNPSRVPGGLPGRQMGGFWDRNMIDPNTVSGFDPLGALNHGAGEFAAPGWWMDRYGPGAKAAPSTGRLSTAEQNVMNALRADRARRGVDLNTGLERGSGTEREYQNDWIREKAERGDFDWIAREWENMGGRERWGRQNEYGMTRENIKNLEAGEGPGLNKWGQALGTAAPINAFGGSKARRGGKKYGKLKMLASYGYKKDGSGVSKNEAMEQYNRSQGKLGPVLKDLRRKKARYSKGKGGGGGGGGWVNRNGGGGGGNVLNPPNRTEGSGFSNELINWTW